MFGGIPYAEAPIGERRWQPPAAVKPWQGTRAATEFGPACWQQPTPDSSVYTRGNLDRNEDCLYLNVWTAAEAEAETGPRDGVVSWRGHTGGLGEVRRFLTAHHLRRRGSVCQF
ncbi:MAG: hypothetical protein Ct9H300mP25_17540 [Acidobacteriota bacterium]|nr:MAG: hypothetical protein Ct9H300mP25_17540 [Acidobacteriota bacterium]